MMPKPDAAQMKQVGVGGTYTLAVLWLVFQFLLDLGVVQRADAAGSPTWTATRVDQVATQVQNLHDWHNRRDVDGVLRWYVPRSMTMAVQDQTIVLRELRQAIRDQTKVLERMDRREERRAGGG